MVDGRPQRARFLEQLQAPHRNVEIPAGGHVQAPLPMLAEAVGLVMGSPQP